MVTYKRPGCKSRGVGCYISDRLASLFGGLPDLPNFSGEIRAGFEYRVSGFPTRRADFRAFGGSDMLKCLQLTDRFRHFASHGRRENLDRLYHAVGIDDEPASHVHTGPSFVYTVHLADFPARIGKHGEGKTAVNHLRQLFFLPDLVHEMAVRAARQHLDIEFFKDFGLAGDRRQFRGSNESEIARIETEEDPFPPEIG